MVTVNGIDFFLHGRSPVWVELSLFESNVVVEIAWNRVRCIKLDVGGVVV